MTDTHKLLLALCDALGFEIEEVEVEYTYKYRAMGPIDYLIEKISKKHSKKWETRLGTYSDYKITKKEPVS